MGIDPSLSIPTPDGRTIYGFFNQAGPAHSDRLLILSHGLTGNTREFLHVMAKRSFTAHGYDVARFSYYHMQKGARKLRECTLATHAQDLNTVVEHFRSKYSKIFIAGHSYGGLTILFANPKVTAVSYWDPTWTPAWQHEVIPKAEIKCFAMNTGQENLVGKDMLDEAANLALNPPYEKAREFNVPAQVVLAKGEEKPGRNRDGLFKALICTKELQWVDDADHEFTYGDSVEQLMGHALRWFNTFCTVRKKS